MLSQNACSGWGTCCQSLNFENVLSLIQFSSVAQLRPTLCDPMDCSTPGFPVHHKLPEFTQTYIHWVGDAIQPSHPLSPPSPPAFSLSQHQGIFPMSQFFTSGGQTIGVSASASVLPMNTHSGLISFRMDWLDLLVLQGIRQESSPTPQFKSTKELMLLNCGSGEDSWESLGLQGDSTSPS